MIVQSQNTTLPHPLFSVEDALPLLNTRLKNARLYGIPKVREDQLAGIIFISTDECGDRFDFDIIETDDLRTQWTWEIAGPSREVFTVRKETAENLVKLFDCAIKSFSLAAAHIKEEREINEY